MFSRACHQLHFFPRLSSHSFPLRLSPVVCFPAPVKTCFYFRACHQFTSCMLSCAGTCCMLCLSPLVISCMFSPSLITTCFYSRHHQLHVFLRMASVSCFLASGACFMFSRAWRQLLIFAHLELVLRLIAFDC